MEEDAYYVYFTNEYKFSIDGEPVTLEELGEICKVSEEKKGNISSVTSLKMH